MITQEIKYFIAKGSEPASVTYVWMDDVLVGVCGQEPDGSKEVSEKTFIKAREEWSAYVKSEWQKGLDEAKSRADECMKILASAFTSDQIEALKESGLIS